MKQGSHEMTFALANDAQLVHGTTALSLDDLSSNVGRPVKVRYSTAAGTKLASRVEVRAGATDPAPRTPHKS